MKKILIAVTVLMTTHVYSQHVQIGIKAGAVFANCKIDYADPSAKNMFKTKVGPMGGIFLSVPVSKKIIFRPGFDIVGKGARGRLFDQYSGTYLYPDGLPFTYLEIPLNILYEIKNKNGKLGLGAGPGIGLRFSSNYTYLHTKDPEIEGDIDIYYEFPIGFIVNLNYTRGFNNLSADKTYISTLKNYYWGLSVGYLF